MATVNCPKCNYLILSNEVKSGFGKLRCPSCNVGLAMSKKTQLWLIPLMAMIIINTIMWGIDGSGNIDRPIELLSILAGIIGVLGLTMTFKYDAIED